MIILIIILQELLRQGEQLDNIEEKTTEIDKNLTTTQKHLNSIKSVFGGIKNWWGGKKDEAPKETQSSSSRLRKTVDEGSKPNGEHPSLRIKSDDCRGFYEDDEDQLNSRFMQGARSSQGQDYGSSSTQRVIQPVTNSAREEEVDRNLGMKPQSN